jgi:hypothetical protein
MDLVQICNVSQSWNCEDGKKENNLTEERRWKRNSLIHKIKAEVKALKRLFDMVQILDHCISHS